MLKAQKCNIDDIGKLQYIYSPMAALFLALLLVFAPQARCRLSPHARITLVAEAGDSASRQMLAESDEDTAAFGMDDTTIPDQYIVVLKPGGFMATAAAELVQEVTSAMSAAGQHIGVASFEAASGTVEPSIQLVRTIGASTQEAATADKSASEGVATAAAAAADSSSTSRGLQALVLTAPAAAVPHIRRSQLVAAIIQDRRLVPQQAGCVESQYLTLGITAAPAATFKWPNCIVPTNGKLVWKGTRCSEDPNRVIYTELQSVNKNTNEVITVAGKPCILRPNKAQATWTRQRFGGCGQAPLFARSLPTRVCAATGGSLDSPPSGSNSTPSTFGISIPIIGAALPRIAVEGGDQVPPGITRIEAARATGVVNTAGLPAAQQVTVAVLDSGVDATHPDINYVGGKSWAEPSQKLSNDTADPAVDLYGHGTHVSGIVGARNNGAGVVGVAPGVPVFSLKMLNGEGIGSLSSAMDAVKWAISDEGKAAGIKVINLSLAAYVDPASPDYAQTVNSVCSVFQEASNAGVVVVASAGNYAKSMRDYLPAACPTVMAVTAMSQDENAPSSFSNWLPDDASSAEKATVIAAPGSSILSTISFARDVKGYRELSGTSMASPHVAGIAATCIMSGACAAAASGVEKLATIQAAAQERLGLAAGYGFTGDAASTAAGKYFGYLAWAKY